MHEITTKRVIIIGAGLGALYAALMLAPYPSLIISPEPLGEGASSAWAQGGIAASIGAGDSSKAHATDTINAGAEIVDNLIALLVTSQAPEHIRFLTQIGAPFDRSDQGAYILSHEAAHSMPRVVRVNGDQAGIAIMKVLIEKVRATPQIQVLEGVKAISLISENNRVSGVNIIKTPPQDELLSSSHTALSQIYPIKGPAVLLAGGGVGGLYALSTNPPRIKGEALGMAAQAGAIIADAEFVQFHPTAVDCGIEPAPLATEALRGEGATLINRLGERFMLDKHPSAELAPRDIVARTVFEQSQAGLRPMLDARTAIGPRIKTDFPTVSETCLLIGIDPVKDPIPVAAAAHYHMGGVATDKNGRSNLKNLWVCGETASTGLHGANRLASNGLLEALVFARACAKDILESVPSINEKISQITLDQTVFSAQKATADTAALSEPGPDPLLVNRLRQTMTSNVGVIRDEASLRRALCDIAQIESAQPDCTALLNMTTAATLIAAASLKREESRGAHFRSDFATQNPNLAKRAQLTLDEAIAIRASAALTISESV